MSIQYNDPDQSYPLTPTWCRMARAALGWSQTRLAREAEIGKQTIADFERGARQPQWRTQRDLRQTFERAGVAFQADGSVRPPQNAR